MIESTGTFLPVAVPIIAHSALKAMKFIDPADAQKKMPAMRRVKRKAGFRPTRSLDNPQNEAPMIKPM